MRFDIGALPSASLEAAAAFYAEVLPLIERVVIDPLRESSAEPALADGASPAVQDVLPASADAAAAAGLTLVFAPAEPAQSGWRVAAVQALARAHAPLRINAVASDDERAIAGAARYLAAAAGVTGQYWVLDGNGAGEVLS